MSLGPGSMLPSDGEGSLEPGGTVELLAGRLAQPGSLALAREALGHFGFSAVSTLALVPGSGCVVYRIDDPVNDERAALRLHRRGTYDISHIKSEMQWLDALRGDRRLDVPPPITARSGDRVVRVEGEDGPQLATVCGWMDGAAPDAGADRVKEFARLGAVTARLHDHAASWTLPGGFCRPTWSGERLLGARPAFGDWRLGVGVGGEEHAVLQAAEDAVRLALATFDTSRESYGLIHANLRLSNLRMARRADGTEVVRVIRFDDCGPSWFMYDFSAAVSAADDVPRLPDLIASWAAGYRTERELSAVQEAQLPTFAMLQRLVLVGWAGSVEDDTAVATTLGAAYTASACELAERYLAGAAPG